MDQDQPVRGVWGRILREPLTHFLIAGLALFAVAHWIEQSSRRYAIEVGPEEVQRIADSFSQQFGAPPTPAQLKTLVDNHVREEVFLREGLALGLDRDDEIVRRRIAQKFAFLQADMAVPRAPSDAELRRWFTAHRARYTVPARRSFDHIYFAIDQRGDAAARALAADSLAGLRAGRASPAGDEFPGPRVIRLMSRADTERLFGGEDFAARIFAAPPHQWTGPFRSGFGWHISRVTETQAPHPRSFEEAEADVAADWTEAERLARNSQLYGQLLARYRVTRPDTQP